MIIGGRQSSASQLNIHHRPLPSLDLRVDSEATSRLAATKRMMELTTNAIPLIPSHPLPHHFPSRTLLPVSLQNQLGHHQIHLLDILWLE